jgi:predicted NACHT family NTPase
MPDPVTVTAIAKAAGAIASLFKTAAQALPWAKDKWTELDLSKAATTYLENLDRRYGDIKILGMAEPVKLRKIYVRVNILQKVQAQRRVDLEELEQFFDRERRSLRQTITTKDGIKVVDELEKFVVLGKPGAGKSTFLKYVAIQHAVADNRLKKTRLPIFVTLKRLSDSQKSLLDFIVGEFDVCNFPDAKPFVEKILHTGGCVVLLDGLDEVSAERETAIIREVQDFADKYHHNQFILSCRVAAYGAPFEKFTDVEMADFNDVQIREFINQWFGEQKEKAEACRKDLNAEPATKELASVPLLLTLLCIAFDASMRFPKNRAELYNDAIKALLQQWDASRSIKRAEIYKGLSLKHKETLLSRIEEGKYFLPQRTLEDHIARFIGNLPEVKPEDAAPDSAVVLKMIEAQHGLFTERARNIYSFSHLTVQEYFTARYIVDNVAQGALTKLAENHLTDDRWREVFLLTAGLLPQADDLIHAMKRRTDALLNREVRNWLDRLSKNTKLKVWLIEKNLLNNVFLSSQSQLVKIFFVIDLTRNTLPYIGRLVLDDFAHDLEYAHSRACERFREWGYEIDLPLILLRLASDLRDLNRDLDHGLHYARELASPKACELEVTFGLNIDLEFFLCQKNIGSFEYYLLGWLRIVECLTKSGCYVSKETREKILSEVLLPPRVADQTPDAESN